MTAQEDGLTVLDPRFPIRVTEPAPIWQRALLDTGIPDLIMRETTRAAQRDTVVEERFVRRIAEQTAPMAAIPAGPVYPELAPAALEATAPRPVAAVAVYADPHPRPWGWRRRGRRAA